MKLFGSKELESEQGRLKQDGTDTVNLVIAYLKQETVEPLKGAGRYVAFGGAGSVLLCIGFVLLLLAALRALQTETGTTFAGHLSWLPYVIVSVAALIVIALAASRVARGPASRRRPAPSEEKI